MILGNEKGEIILLELPFLKVRKIIIASQNNPAYSLVISNDRRFLLYGCIDGDISIITDPNIKYANSSQTQ